MKHRISISLEEETVLKMKEKVRISSEFRNQSHLVEEAIRKIVEDE